MKKIIIALALVLVLVSVVKLHADTNGSVGSRTISVNTGYGTLEVYKFVDPDNGNVCYLSQPQGYRGLGIACVK
jgi:catabolite regulation protein CreA